MAHNLVAPKEYRSCREESSGHAVDSPSCSSPVEAVSLPLLKKRTKKTRTISKIESESSTSTSDVFPPEQTKRRRRMNYDGSTPSNKATNTTGLVEGNERQNLTSTPTTTYGSTANNAVEIATADKWQRNERFFSVMLFLILLVLGMTLVICSCIKSDSFGREITPQVVKIYTIILIIVFIIWLVGDQVSSWKRNADESSNEESGSLIPSHLLNGLALFGVGSSVCQVVTILDFIKCRKYISHLDNTYLVYPFFEMAFMFSQLYVFYHLSKDRERKMLFGNAFTMFTLAVNLTIWAIYFFAGATNSNQLRGQKWLTHYYYGLENNDSCSGKFVHVGNYSQQLHKLQSQMMPFMYTLAMEYSLLASALLFHLWSGLTQRYAGEYGAVEKKKWCIWRCSFILGLLTLPLLGTMAVNATAEVNHTKIFIVFCGECFLFVLLFICGWFGLKHVKTDSFCDVTGPAKVDVILLCMSWVGFVLYDLFTMYAATAVILRKFDALAFGLGIVSLVELICTGMLTAFLIKAYSRKLRVSLSQNQCVPPKRIRQIASFCVIVSFGFWAMRTYSFRSSYTFDFVGSDFFGKISWFIITQLSVPFCTFYHFHSAVCFTEVIAGSSP